MKILQNFSSKKHIKELPITDILIWYLGTSRLKGYGHTLKLYCEEKDLDFLKEWGLFDLYDEVDTEFLSNNELFEIINQENFWSIRKIECINHEYEISEEPFIYMDTDIVMNMPVHMAGDLLVWSPEQKQEIYVPWECLSAPYDYVMPEYIYKMDKAYNCGILGFKSKELFDLYRKEYLTFVINNPCITFDLEATEETIRNIWACNAEQRILRAVANNNKWGVYTIMPTQIPGACNAGIHYYLCRAFWRQLNKNELNDDAREYWIGILNDQIRLLMSILKEQNSEMFNKFISIDWIKDCVENNINIEEYK